MVAFGALGLYAIGKTFFWPTMLAVVSERFPNGGAVTLGMVGGVGMLSAGLLGGPGIGFEQDKFASEKLQEVSPGTFARYKAANENSFLVFKTNGLDGQKVATLGDDGASITKELEIIERTGEGNDSLVALNSWWQGEAKDKAAEDKGPVQEATLHGSRMALKLTAIVPVVMAICYLVLILYFKSIGGYKALTVDIEETTALGTGES
jgi:hypothetical protein